MRNSFPIKEEVYVIDSGDYVGSYIFPDYSADAKIHQGVNAVIVGGINGNRNPLVKAFSEADRNSDFKLVNINKVRGYDIKQVDVPVGIKTKVDEYNELMVELRKEQLKDEEQDMELFNKVSKISRELIEYFEN